MHTRLDLSTKLILFSVGSSVALGRWGAWIGFPSKSLFLIDLTLMSALILSLGKKRIEKTIMVLLLLVFILVQLTRNSDSNIFLKIRDLMPFVYLLIFLVLKSQISAVPREILYKTFRFATLISLVWNLSRSLGILETYDLRNFVGIPVFSQRPDHFGIVACIGLIVWSDLKSSSTFFWRLIVNFLLASFIIEVIFLPSRAGFLALMVALIFLFVQNHVVTQIRILFSFILITFVFVVSASTLHLILPKESIVNKTFNFSVNNDFLEQGKGSARGRVLGQRALLVWVQSNQLILAGGGPGREILQESGAIRWLSGDADVRYPHNWWVSLLARFGVLGFLFWSILMSFLWRDQSFKEFSPRSAIMSSILVASSFGVILESPFGAIPLYFFLMTKNQTFKKI